LVHGIPPEMVPIMKQVGADVTPVAQSMIKSISEAMDLWLSVSPAHLQRFSTILIY
jgi:hypothetical protein